MKFQGKFAVPRLDLAGYRAALDKRMREAIAQGVMEWLNAVLDKIPDWSGASRATFVKLAQTIGMNVPISPTPTAMGSVGDRSSEGQNNSQGKLNLDTPPGRYTFKYQTSLPHLIWNEYHNANQDPDETKWPKPALLLNPGPYEFQAKGLMAFMQFAKSVDLPAVRPFVQVKKIKAG